MSLNRRFLKQESRGTKRGFYSDILKVPQKKSMLTDSPSHSL
jgi:hypothetical protein